MRLWKWERNEINGELYPLPFIAETKNDAELVDWNEYVSTGIIRLTGGWSISLDKTDVAALRDYLQKVETNTGEL